jgi:hypothetical protein
MLDPNGCLARSAMRTQPSTEETGAVQNNVAGLQRLKWIWQLALPKKALRYLTTGRLMGVTVTPNSGRMRDKVSAHVVWRRRNDQ